MWWPGMRRQSARDTTVPAPPDAQSEAADGRPSVAEQARTTLAVASSVRLGVAGGGAEVVRHVVALDGSVVMVVGERSPAVSSLLNATAAHVPTQVRAVHVAPVPVPGRVRGSVAVTGRLHLHDEPLPDGVLQHLQGPGGVWADRPVVRLVPRRVVLQQRLPTATTGQDGVWEIDLPHYRDARVDPLVGVEEEWLHHLDLCHRALLAALVSGPADRVWPLRVGRGGLTLRVRRPHGRHLEDVWVPFSAPVACGCDLGDAFHALTSAAAPELGRACSDEEH